MNPRVAVIRFPGSNCETESLEAVKRAGLDGRILRWNEPAELDAYDAYFLPGGFSYQDRIRAGVVAARLPVMEVIARRAQEGAPVIGLCNGAQILVEAGLVPDDGTIQAALAPNQIAGRTGYYTRWIFLVPGPAAERCLFTRTLAEALPMPTAHGEGRYIARDEAGLAQIERQTALRFGDETGAPADRFPAIPNGSHFGAAGVCNAAGNVLALMPHPDRALRVAQVPPWLPGEWGELRRAARSARELEADGPGMAIFRGLARALKEGR